MFLEKDLVVQGHDHRPILQQFFVQDVRTGAPSTITVANGGAFQNGNDLAVEIDATVAGVRLINRDGSQTTEWITFAKPSANSEAQRA
ncbi:MAG: hypothetical protein Q7R81_05185 [Candidatus Peregrinibacteria bacterium]|nr:hypothetical protein [Candidatus Peregrinibacteria bacterium]